MAILSRTLRGCAVMAVWLVLGAGPAAAQQRAEPAEYEVKSAYLFNLLQYVAWPPPALRDAGELRLCVLGDDPMGDLLRRAIGRRRVAGHEVRIVAVARAVEADRCHAAFIASRNSIPMESWLARLRDQPVLTVGEGTAFARAGGMIALVLDAGTVRFEVNAASLRQSRLQLSSRVLRLATEVHGE